MVGKVPVYHHVFTITNLLPTCKKREESSFAKQCSSIDNGSTLPSLFTLITDKSFSDVNFSVEDIKNIFSGFNNKAHGDDMISIRILKLCNESICKVLIIIFKSYLPQGIFQKTKQNKTKNKKQCVKNYRPVSILPICRKVLERIIYNTVFMYFMQNNLISESQSGFDPGYSFMNNYNY